MRYATILFLAMTLTADALYVNLNTQREEATLPRISVDIGGAILPVGTLDQLLPLGWREGERTNAPAGTVEVSRSWVQDGNDARRAVCILITRTQAEQDAINAQVEADIAAQRLLPAELPNGIAVKDGTDAVTVAVSAGEVIAFKGTNKAEAIFARQAIRDDLKNIKGSVATNTAEVQATASLTNGFTASENRRLVNALRKELIDALKDLQDLRRAQSQALKEQNP